MFARGHRLRTIAESAQGKTEDGVVSAIRTGDQGLDGKPKRTVCTKWTVVLMFALLFAVRETVMMVRVSLWGNQDGDQTLLSDEVAVAAENHHPRRQEEQEQGEQQEQQSSSSSFFRNKTSSSAAASLWTSHRHHGAAIPPFVNRSFRFDKEMAEAALEKWGAAALRPILSAYVETIPELQNHLNASITDYNTSRDDASRQHDILAYLDVLNATEQHEIPLPVRTVSPNDLAKFQYPKLQTCHDIPGKLPVDRGVQYDNYGNVIEWNLLQKLQELHNITSPNDTRSILDDPRDCPVDVDPFLPWIHDIFPSLDGTKIHILSQNKRQCTISAPAVSHLAPQVALAQHVSVERITHAQAVQLAPTLWNSHINRNHKPTDDEVALPRYRLVPHTNASSDGMDTRYICRFHGLDVTTSPPQWVIVGETLSTFPYSYEFNFLRTGESLLSTPDHADFSNFRQSHFQFNCPVPFANNNSNATFHLPKLLASGETILSDGSPTLALSIIPIRTPPRYGASFYLSSDYVGPIWPSEGFGTYFDAAKYWGFQHVLPQVEASGRWEFLPLCHPPQQMSRPDGLGRRSSLSQERATQKHRQQHHTGSENTTDQTTLLSSSSTLGTNASKPYMLTACVWTSAIYKSPNGYYLLTENVDRLVEWIEFHLMVGFDHLFIYDNSASQGFLNNNGPGQVEADRRTLQHVVNMFPPSQVTLIEWRAIICSNDIMPAEWSSQYAAENSCLARHGPFTEWMASLDVDEYLVPLGNFSDLKSLIRHVSEREETKILMFRSSRAKLRFDSSVDVNGDGKRGREKLSNVTFLEAYNCDCVDVPKPVEWTEHQRKEIYRPDYVHHHWVHYSTFTHRLTETYKEAEEKAKATKRRHSWKLFHWQDPEPLQRFANELDEGIMLHTKTTKFPETESYEELCHVNQSNYYCEVGFPWPNRSSATILSPGDEGSFNDQGMRYNCFPYDKVSNYWIPRLREAMERRKRTLARLNKDTKINKAKASVHL